MKEMLLQIEAIQATLDKIEIKGRVNIDKMLGCMQALDELTEKLKEVMKNGTGNS